MTNSTLNSVFQSLTILEVVLNISTYIITGICYYVFIKYPMFHTNFIRLIKIVFIFYMTAQSLRLATAIHEILNIHEMNFKNVSKNYLLLSGSGGFSIVGIVKLFCFVSVYAATGSVAFERIYATVKLRTYETTISNKLSAICITYQTMLSAVATYGIYSDRITVVAVGIFVIVGNVTFCIILRLLERFNRIRHRTSLLQPQMYSLSERFQLNENIKTAKIIGRVAEVVNIFNLIMGSFIAFSYYYETEILRRSAYVLLHLFLCFYGYAFAIVGMASNPIWYMKFKKIITSLAQMKRVAPMDAGEAQQRINLGKQLLNHNGKQMLFTVDEERELYFKQLQKGWN